MKTKMIYDLVKQVKETGVGADGTVVCSMDELVDLIDKKSHQYGYNDGYCDGYDQGYDDALTQTEE